MKLVTTWYCPPENRNATIARFKETGGDKPPAGVKLLGRWFAVGGGKGVHVCEADDPMVMAKWAAVWSDLLSIEIYPAVDDEDAKKLFG